MTLEFDINKKPPGRDEIAAVRDQARHDHDHIWQRMKPFLVVAVTALVLLLAFQFTIMIPYIADPGANRTVLAVVGIFIPYMAFLLFALANNLRHKYIENPRKALKETIEGLEPASTEELAEVDELISEGEEYLPVADYKRKVDAIGRPLVKAELDAIQRWLDRQEAEQKNNRRQSAA